VCYECLPCSHWVGYKSPPAPHPVGYGWALRTSPMMSREERKPHVIWPAQRQNASQETLKIEIEELSDILSLCHCGTLPCPPPPAIPLVTAPTATTCLGRKAGDSPHPQRTQAARLPSDSLRRLRKFGNVSRRSVHGLCERSPVPSLEQADHPLTPSTLPAASGNSSRHHQGPPQDILSSTCTGTHSLPPVRVAQWLALLPHSARAARWLCTAASQRQGPSFDSRLGGHCLCGVCTFSPRVCARGFPPRGTGFLPQSERRAG